MIEIKVPELGESITEGTISNWVIKEGEFVSEGDIILEIETDKVNLEVNAGHNGILAEIKKQTGETVEVGEVIALLNEEVAKEKNRQSNDIPLEEKEGNKKNNASLASPAARRLARERGLDLNQVQGKDPIGRINKYDLNYIEKKVTPSLKPVRNKHNQDNEVDAGQGNAKLVERQRMSRRRLSIVNRLVEAQQTAAMLTTFNEVDMTAIIDLRRRRKETFREKYNVGLGYMSFFTKAVVGALKAFPLLNAEIEGEDILI